jgi:hypothetical protein
MEDGGLWWRAPISAFCWKECEHQELTELTLWDCFSNVFSITEFSLLKQKKIFYKNRENKQVSGTYLFTIDWASEETDFGFSESPSQHKCGHVIKLDNGNFAIQPNNRVLLFDPSFTTKFGELLTERKVNTHIFTAENTPKWKTEDSDNFFYDVENIQYG